VIIFPDLRHFASFVAVLFVAESCVAEFFDGVNFADALICAGGLFASFSASASDFFLSFPASGADAFSYAYC